MKNTKKNGVVFTPPFVSDLILDYAMPYKNITGHETIFDPTCGSGVFLVGAFRRLIYNWRKMNDWNRPSVQVLQKMLRNSIFGAKLDENAAHIASFQTLKDYLDKQAWTCGEGFFVGNKKHEAAWLTGKPFLLTDAIDENGINEEKINTVPDEKFQYTPKESRFKAPLILIKTNEKLQMGFWKNGDLSFLKSIVSINSPQEDSKRLFDFFNAFKRNKDILRACCLLKSSRALFGRSTSILKRNIDELPWPNNDCSLDFLNGK